MDTDKIKIFGARVRVDTTGKLAELERAERVIIIIFKRQNHFFLLLFLLIIIKQIIIIIIIHRIK